MINHLGETDHVTAMILRDYFVEHNTKQFIHQHKHQLAEVYLDHSIVGKNNYLSFNWCINNHVTYLLPNGGSHFCNDTQTSDTSLIGMHMCWHLYAIVVFCALCFVKLNIILCDCKYLY